MQFDLKNLCHIILYGKIIFTVRVFMIFKSHRTKDSHGQIILILFVLILEFKIQPGKPHAPKF